MTDMIKSQPKKRIVIGNTDIGKFSIVYQIEETGHVKEFAEWIGAAIEAACGISLPLFSDDAPLLVHEILVGNTNRPESQEFFKLYNTDLLHYHFGLHGQKYTIVGGGMFSLMKAVEHFIEQYLQEDGATTVIQADEVVSNVHENGTVAHANGSLIRIMTHNIMAVRHAKHWFHESNPPTAPKRIEIIQAVLRAYTPDVVGYQEACDGWRQTLAAELDPSVWGIFDPGRADGSNGETIFIYNKNRLKLIDAAPVAYPEYAYNSRIVWAHFACLAHPEKQFLIYNTHWAGHAAKPDTEQGLAANMEKDAMAKLIFDMRREHGGIPAFTTGDYNTYYQADRYFSFREISGLTDSFDLAREAGDGVLQNICGGCSRRGGDRDATPLSESIDHIFCPHDTKIHRYETVTGYRVNELSDHSPRYVDVSF